MKEELYDLVEIRVKFSDFQSGFRSWGCSWKPALVHSSEKLIHFCQEWYFCQTVGSSHVLSCSFELSQGQKFITAGDWRYCKNWGFTSVAALPRLGHLIFHIIFPTKGSSNRNTAFNNYISVWSANWEVKGFFLSFKTEGHCLDSWI